VRFTVPINPILDSLRWRAIKARRRQSVFRQAHGARLFQQGKPRALLEVKSPEILTAIYEARLGGYDRAKAAKEWKADG
jgi:hypothetical protein